MSPKQIMCTCLHTVQWIVASRQVHVYMQGRSQDIGEGGAHPGGIRARSARLLAAQRNFLEQEATPINNDVTLNLSS